jgi:hypothetical protein
MVEEILGKKIIPKEVLNKNLVREKPILKKPILKSPLSKQTLESPLKKSLEKNKPNNLEEKKVEPPEAKKEKKFVSTKINVSSVKDIFKIIGNKEFFEIYNSVLEMDKEFFTRGFSGTFEDKKELSLFFKSRISDFIKGRYGDIRSKITEFRKAGYEVNYVDLKSLIIPLKMKVLEINFTLEEFNKIKQIFVFLEDFFKKVEIQRKKDEQEFEERQKQKEIEFKRGREERKKKVDELSLSRKEEEKMVKKKEN